MSVAPRLHGTSSNHRRLQCRSQFGSCSASPLGLCLFFSQQSEFIAGATSSLALRKLLTGAPTSDRAAIGIAGPSEHISIAWRTFQFTQESSWPCLLRTSTVQSLMD